MSSRAPNRLASSLQVSASGAVSPDFEPSMACSTARPLAVAASIAAAQAAVMASLLLGVPSWVRNATATSAGSGAASSSAIPLRTGSPEAAQSAKCRARTASGTPRPVSDGLIRMLVMA